VLDGINFAKDYQKDSYKTNKFIEKNIDDKNILVTLRKHSTLKNVEYKNLKNSKNVSNLFLNFKVFRVLYHI